MVLTGLLTASAQVTTDTIKDSNMGMLQDKQELKELVDVFSILADKKDAEAQTLLFTEDATVASYRNGKHISTYTGRKEIGNAFGNFLALFETVYHINGQQVVNIDGDSATGVAYCLVVLIENRDGKRIMNTQGVRYDDEYVRQDGRWLINKRTSHFEWSDKKEVVQEQESGQVENDNADVPMIKLKNGAEMPQFGLGLFMIPDGDMAYSSVLTALQNGYRHFDSAHAYRNERSVGKAVRDSRVPREEIWVTSKLWPNEYGEGKTLAAIDRMLDRFGFDYLDMVYLHQPVGDYVGAWKELEQAIEQGKVRAIGISNFDYNDELFDSFISTMRIKPDAMQIECHPYAQRTHWQEKLKGHGIALECWFPLGGRSSNGEILRDETINRIAQAHGKTAAQVIIRWHIQEGFSVIPGTDNPDYIKENISVFDFSLTDDEMQAIRALNKEYRYFNMTFDQIQKQFGGYEITD